MFMQHTKALTRSFEKILKKNTCFKNAIRTKYTSLWPNIDGRSHLNEHRTPKVTKPKDIDDRLANTQPHGAHIMLF